MQNSWTSSNSGKRDTGLSSRPVQSTHLRQPFLITTANETLLQGLIIQKNLHSSPPLSNPFHMIPLQAELEVDDLMTGCIYV